jgi:aminopeptidase N
VALHRPTPRPTPRPTRSLRRTAALLSAALAVTLTGAGAGAAGASTAEPGGRSAHDSLFRHIGNTGYDARHYAITLRYSHTTRRIAATTTITAQAQQRLSSYSFDLQGLTVRGVRVDGRPAAFRRNGNKLVVTPSRAVSGRFTTTVRYGGRPVTHIDPDGSEDGWIPTSDGATVLGEPLGAMTWFPDNDTPRDKATYTMRITAPSASAVASNGDLVRRAGHDGATTWTWRQRRPMAPYLAMISIGRYRVYHSTMRTTTGRRLPVWSFVDPRLGTLAGKRRLVPQVIRFEERRFGPYPQTSVGIVVKDLGVGYALETQNRPVFDGTPDTLTLVHELAHQWYGDSVTPRDWQDVWLNEGFATYAEALWTAAHGGPGTRTAYRRIYDRRAASAGLWRPAPARFSDPADLFGDPVYVRGAMTLEALRERVGSPDFFRILRRWAASRAGGTVSTAELVAVAERVSGRNLGPFFDEWLYTAGKPSSF